MVVGLKAIKVLRNVLVEQLSEKLDKVAKSEHSEKELKQILFWPCIKTSIKCVIGAMLIIPVTILMAIVEVTLIFPVAMYVAIDMCLIIYWYRKQYIEKARNHEDAS